MVYAEIDDMYELNATVENIKKLLPEEFTHRIIASKSGKEGNIGLEIVINSKTDFDILRLCEISHIVYVAEE
ncbi:MAG: hypothetical protein KBS52_03570 [Clostridiales bacterium]|nr:hypothetical protein [Candidatus Equinaster intestinalis]